MIAEYARVFCHVSKACVDVKVADTGKITLDSAVFQTPHDSLVCDKIREFLGILSWFPSEVRIFIQ
jgi:hypothetical protein